ncbi:alkaline phosphatase family protein [Haloplanus pelagicus]|uniref:alkaline phosphatase family protein n=1 Tax=Haloplanus pelagicus TaxID=2949995 RepID=UPI00203FB7E8|nr:alkaline phosphatase family protein [Haloplanus sp. HW8-1]
MKTLVIGLDGATYNVLEPLLDEGRLPNLQNLIETGTAGTLDSTVPPATYPAWKCYSTGQHPTKLGFHSFLGFKQGNLEPASTDAPEIWDYVCEQGGTAASINMPTSYPASELDGFMTSGYVIGGDDWIYPEEMREFVEEEFDYRPEVSFPVHTELLAEDTAEARAEIRSVMQSRFELAKFALNELSLDFLQLTMYYTDTYQHFFWNQPEILNEMWEYVDEQLGDVLDRVPDGTNVFVVSDHGFERLDTGIFYLNRWLEKEGYLTLEGNETTGLFERLSVDTKTLSAWLDRFGLMPLVRALVPESTRRKVPNPRGEVGVDQLSERLVWEESDAVMYGGGIFLNVDRLGPRYEEVRTELMERVTEITSPETGDPVLVDAYRPEELYAPGETLPRDDDEVPDVLLLPRDEGFVSPAYSPNVWNTTDLEGRWSVHAKPGIFIANGPDIRESSADLDIFDVAPTVLHAMGYPIAEEMDGRVRKDIFSAESEPATREVEYRGERTRIDSAVRALEDGL